MKLSEIKKKSTAAATVATATMLPAMAFANDLQGPDTTKIVTYITVTAVAAVVAIGGAKMVPAAAMWLYTAITSMIKRG